MYGPASGGGGRGGGSNGSSSSSQPARQFTPRGQMSGGGNQRPPLTDLAPGMKLMFEPRMPLEYKPPLLLSKRPNPPCTGISAFLSPDLFEKEAPPPPPPIELPSERKERLRLHVQHITYTSS